MSFQDETSEPAAHKPALCFVCARCRQTFTVQCVDVNAEICRRLAAGEMYATHRCTGAWLGQRGSGAIGIGTLVGGVEEPPVEQESTP